MDTEELRGALGSNLCDGRDLTLSISSHVLRRVGSEGTLVAVGGEHKNEEYALYALLDALHLRVAKAHGQGPVRVVIGGNPNAPDRTERLVEAIATMAKAVRHRVEVTVEVDLKPRALETMPPDAKPAWPGQLVGREKLLADLPRLAQQLSDRIDSGAFRWYATLYSKHLSGRVDGLEVCTVELSRPRGSLGIGGNASQDKSAQNRFEELAGRPGPWSFTEDDIETAVDIVTRLITDRRRADDSEHLGKLQREHLLESRVLGPGPEVTVALEDGRVLVPEVGQLPTLWAHGGSPRYLDVLARDGNQPWAVELKVPSGGGHGKYYRHAVGQVVLYREFIRRTSRLGPWFRGRGLDPTRCRAAVAFPKVTGDAAQRLKEVKTIAELFDVEVIQLDIETIDAAA